MTVRLVSALWADYHPFDNLPGISDYACVDNPDELSPGDILISHGGEDISPTLYGKGRSYWTGANDEPSQRDTAEWNLMLRARELDIPIIGLCRGAQMLCALAGGFLIQDVENHAGDYHGVTTYDGVEITVNSIHHQMMYPFDVKHELIGWSSKKLSSFHWDVDGSLEITVEPEFVYFPEVKGFAIQWHPEMMQITAPATQYVFKHILERV